ncbi:MAG: type IV pilin-like G/H family protein [Lyngbya sp. HA4199-MV5]|jgi:type II secretory pathway pseudopilin PulG|nr:type IV pilin-like G/H family protein [Lyngbya sp. HA4199-MV5]
MTQPNLLEPNLLERAQQGDPHAIAALMNLTLEPQGVVARAVVEEDCLHVFLSAARALNAKTLVAFIQRGILRLDVSSIQRVLVYGQRLSDDQPDWVEAFMLPRSPVAEALEALSHPSTASTVHPEAIPVPALPTPTLVDEWKQQWTVNTQQVQASLNHVVTASKQWVARRRDRPNETDPTSEGSRSKAAPSYLKLSLLVTLIAFVTGGAVALIAHSYTTRSADRKAGSNGSAIALNSQQSIKSEAERKREQQQATAKTYLETMNQAQQTFYRQNKRFASTLEELERFAAVPIASRSDYAYKLTVPSYTQSQLSAVPKADGLKSYTAAVSITKTTNQSVATICTSQQAAKVPPLVFQSPEGRVQCPVETSKTP